MSALFGVIAKKNFIQKNYIDKITILKEQLSNVYSETREVKSKNAYFICGNILPDKHMVLNSSSINYLIEGEFFLRNEYVNLFDIKLLNSEYRNHNHLIALLYKKFGIDFINKIKGNFNIVVVDEVKNIIYIANDFLGIKPLYFYENENYFFLFSELKFINYVLEKFDLEINMVALAEFLLLNYPVGKKSFYKKVSLIESGSLIKFYNNSVDFTKYISIDSLYDNELLNSKDSFLFLNDTFKSVVSSYIPESNFALSTTGGFDGRTILSVISNYDNLFTYTFGTENSSDIIVAKEISKALNIRHKAFYINDDYYQNYFLDAAQELILNTDCLATFSRTHYVDTFKKISKTNRIVLSGNGGSELFRVIYQGGAVVSSVFLDLLINRDEFRSTLNKHINDSIIPIIFNNFNRVFLEELIETIKTDLEIFISHKRKNIGLNSFLLLETIRKYFGIEMKAESRYAINRSPYIDQDFIFALNRTPYSSANQSFLTSNPFMRRKGQMVYSYIIANNNKVLASLLTNRGYSPYDVYDKKRLLKVIAPYFRKYLRKTENAFNTDKTNDTFFKYFLNKKFIDNDIISFEKMKDLKETGKWKDNKSQYIKAVSWSYWYKKIVQDNESPFHK